MANARLYGSMPVQMDRHSLFGNCTSEKVLSLKPRLEAARKTLQPWPKLLFLAVAAVTIQGIPATEVLSL